MELREDLEHELGGAVGQREVAEFINADRRSQGKAPGGSRPKARNVEGATSRFEELVDERGLPPDHLILKRGRGKADAGLVDIVIQMRRENFTAQEIARASGLGERTIERYVKGKLDPKSEPEKVSRPHQNVPEEEKSIRQALHRALFPPALALWGDQEGVSADPFA